MKTHTLYYSKYCYFCQKVLMFLRGRQHSVELLNTSDRKNYTDLVEGGGKGQVPCLKINSSNQVEWMYESDDIIRYLKTT